MTIGERIRSMRENAHMTQKEFAEIIGVANGSISKWETGKLDICFANLWKAASCFGVSVSQLVDGTEPNDPNAMQEVKKIRRPQCHQRVKEKRIKKKPTPFYVPDELRAAVAAAPESQRIYVLRKGLGLSQADFGERIGLTVTTISKFENGSRLPSDRTKSLITNAFGVQIGPKNKKPEKLFEEMTVGERIRTLRIQRGLMLKELGKIIGVKISRISAWESGACIPSQENLEKTAEALNVPVATLIVKGENDQPKMTPEERKIMITAMAQRIQMLRKEKGLTQKALAEKISVHTSTVLSWECGHCQISPPNMEKLSQALGVDAEWLKDGAQTLEEKNNNPIDKRQEV